MSWCTRGIYNNRSKKTLRKNLRKSTTSAEAILWTCLQSRKLLGKKCRRQFGIGRYIVDFYCPECRLVVELDGAPHFASNVEEYEANRTKYLESHGIKVIRFENRVVHDQIELVLETIRENVRQTVPPNDHPVCAASVASRLLIFGAATPPFQGGENCIFAIPLEIPRFKKFLNF